MSVTEVGRQCGTRSKLRAPGSSLPRQPIAEQKGLSSRQTPRRCLDGVRIGWDAHGTRRCQSLIVEQRRKPAGDSEQHC